MGVSVQNTEYHDCFSKIGSKGLIIKQVNVHGIVEMRHVLAGGGAHAEFVLLHCSFNLADVGGFTPP